MLFKELDKLKRTTVMMGITLMLSGIVLMIIPEGYIPFLGEVTGFILLVWSCLSVFEFLGSKQALIHHIRLASGLLTAVAGAALLIFENLFIDIVSLLVGTLPVILGLYGIYHTFAYARRSGRRGWWVLAMLSSFLIVFGAAAFFNPWQGSLKANMTVMGVSILYSALLTLISLIWLWPVKSFGEDESNE
ncbi:MAG: DUF308 domain-containing protein [Oscillospiraceae bacterium]|nr:DUF308 domain-containing protein [Oscillospiraceae bacterium]